MSNTRLYVNGVDIPILRDVSIPTTYKIADIREPDKRNADTTLTIEIPSTKLIDEVFEFVFEVNLSLQNFNPNLKTEVKYFINNSLVLQGSLQLNRMLINPLTNDVTYFCNIKGQLTDLFYSIGEKYLTENDNGAYDLDFSDYDHALTKTNYLDNWNPAVSPNTNIISGSPVTVAAGVGYRYPLIDYGLNTGNASDFYVHHQRPGLFLYEYLQKIFAMAGKTWTSSFLDGSFFKSLLIPCTEILEPTASELANKQCYVGWVAGGTINNTSLTNIGAPDFSWDASLNTASIILPDDSTGPYTDPGNIYNTGTGEITIPQKNTYTIKSGLSISTFVNYPSDPFNFYVDTYDVSCLIYTERWDGATWTNIGGSSVLSGTGLSGSTANCFTNSFYINTQFAFNASDKVRLRIDCFLSKIVLRKISDGSIITTGTASYDLDISLYAPGDPFAIQPYLSSSVTDINIYEGDTVEVNKTIPKKIKQKDLFKSTINAFNLYVLPDKTNPNNYIIEPRGDFYSSDYYDWTSKLDAGKGMEIIPMGELDAKQFKYKYKQGGDYYNKAYQDSWQEVYGEVTFEAENEFVTGDKTTELIFSPTPLVGNTLNDLIIPKIYKNDNGVISVTKENIRLLIWGGAIANTISWNLYTIAGLDSIWYSFPYAGHLDDPYIPSLDLSFGVPEYVFFDETNYPTTNLFTEYYYAFIAAITNKNSKIVKAYFNLDEVDIEGFDFRKQVYVNGAYYLVNAINDFDVLDPKTTQVELLKLL